MSTDPDRGSRSLPEKPNLRHLKSQAKDLLRSGRAASLTEALFQLAREYGFASWSKLKAHVESLEEIGRLKAAIDANDVARVQTMMTRNPSLHRAPLGYNADGPLTYAAEWPRRVPPTDERLAVLRWMLKNGSDVHQGGDGPLMRAALSDAKLPVMELLVEHGADVNALWAGNYPILVAACETLQPRSLEWLIARGADLHAVARSCIENLMTTAWRNPRGRGDCLEVFVQSGYSLPDTAPMAIHRGRIDLVQALVARDAALVRRRFRETEVFPPELSGVGFTVAPLAGATLLHIAVEYGEKKIAEWLIAHGADVNACAEVDAEGFGGNTPLFHTTVTFSIEADDSLARLLIRNGADPNLRATFRWPCFTRMGDGCPREYRDVTAMGFAMEFQDPHCVNEAAIHAIREHGGK